MGDHNVLKPDPKKGVEAGREYGDGYAATHAEEKNTLDYRFGYAWLLMLDRLMPEGYSLLDVGCGTGGYHRLLSNYRYIVGLDFSKEMITLANEIKARNNLTRTEYLAERYENYDPEQAFDVIDLVGTYGWYVPWHGEEKTLVRTSSMLKSDGVVCFSYVPPRSILSLLKSLLFPRKTVVIRRHAFHMMIEKAGFSVLTVLSYPHVAVVIAKKLN